MEALVVSIPGLTAYWSPKAEYDPFKDYDLKDPVHGVGALFHLPPGANPPSQGGLVRYKGGSSRVESAACG